MSRLVTLLALLVIPLGRARAGECDDECAVHQVEDLEHRAASKTAVGPETFGIFIENDAADLPARAPKLAARIVAACDKILSALPDDQSCVDLAARFGKADLGSHDIVAALGRRKNQHFDQRTIQGFAALHSPRTEAPVIARWKELAPAMAKQEGNADAMNSWAAWRGTAARALASGGVDARAFLVEQIATPKLDRGVKRACQAAIDAIDKRAAKK
jgi:hypothetical protein